MRSFLRRDVPPRVALAVVALALAAAVVGGRAKREPPVVVATAAPTAVPGAATGAAADLDLERLQRQRKAETIPDLFAPPVAPANPPGPAKAPPSEPAKPQFPFRYVGKIIDGGKREVFLARGEAHYSVGAGQTIDNLYKVEKFTDQAVTLVHLPSGARHQVPISAAN